MREVIGHQGGGAWREGRLGKITASGLNHILAKGRDGEAKTRIAYRDQLVAERISGITTQGYQPCEMEIEARCMYEVETDALVDQVGFILHPKWNFAGASPDGLVGKDGGVEIKCYGVDKHMQWVRGDKVPNVHRAQMLWNMICTERPWWDFWAYCPTAPEPHFLKRMDFDKALAASLEIAVWQFEQEIQAAVRSAHAA